MESVAASAALASGVVVEWVNEAQEQLLPYDVTVTTPGGKITYIEVKTVSERPPLVSHSGSGSRESYQV